MAMSADEMFEKMYFYPNNFIRFLCETENPLEEIITLEGIDQKKLMEIMNHPSVRLLTLEYESWLDDEILSQKQL